jgi:integrase
MSTSTPRRLSGKGWHAFYREDRGQWILKHRRTANDWGQHRVPLKDQSEAEVRRYVVAWIDESRRIAVNTVAGVKPAGGLDPNITFRDFGELWTSGDLAKRFADHVRLKKTASDDASRLRLHAYAAIGHIRVVDFAAPQGLELASAVMEQLPAHLSKATRRHVAQLIHKLLGIATFPAKLLAAQPLPRGFMPKLDPPKAAPFLYPDEDTALMKEPKISLGYRLLWGFEMREGPRASEALGLRWSDIDLVRGTVTLDENKTDDPRTWALSEGVVRTLRAWRERYFPAAESTDKVFVGADGSKLDESDHLAGVADRMKARESGGRRGSAPPRSRWRRTAPIA